MSQRTEQLFDYKDRSIGEFYMLADGRIAFDFINYNSIVILNKDSTDRILKLIEDDLRERL
jgi:hypothetical protein